MTYLFDTHAHIQEPEFAEDRQAVVLRAREAGIASIVVPAVDLDSARAALTLAQQFDGIYATAGFHPHEANRLDSEALAEVDAMLQNPKVVAVGEIGLDYFHQHSAREEQIDALGEMLDLAERQALPVIIHARDAWDDIAELLAVWAARVAPRFAGRPLGVMHYFSGSPEQARFHAGLGFLISIHTSVTHPRAEQLRRVAAEMPLEALVIETDSPYGAPQPYRGRRNEPAFVREGARRVAEVRGISLEEVAEATSANARRLFGIAADEAVARLTGAAT